jgi:hypothetical protein
VQQNFKSKKMGMVNVKDAARMLDDLRTIKALDAPVKWNGKIAPRVGLYLAVMVDQGLSGADNWVKKSMSEEDQTKLREWVSELVDKVELGDYYKSLREKLAQP